MAVRECTVSKKRKRERDSVREGGGRNGKEAMGGVIVSSMSNHVQTSIVPVTSSYV
jgi:hypothetical protein